MRKYLPIRIFSIRFAYGWWWGSYFFFIGKKSVAFAIVPCSFHHGDCSYENGLAIGNGDINSWSPTRQSERLEDLKRIKKAEV